MINKLTFLRTDGVHQCTKCNYSSMRVGNIKRHVSLKHLNYWPFQCTLCGKTFKIEAFRIQHYQIAHNMQLSAKDIRLMETKLSDTQ